MVNRPSYKHNRKIFYCGLNDVFNVWQRYVGYLSHHRAKSFFQGITFRGDYILRVSRVFQKICEILSSRNFTLPVVAKISPVKIA